MSKKSKSPQKTLVTFLLDKSQSMEQIRSQTIGAFNEYVNGLKEAKGLIDFTFLQFDDISIEKIFVADPIENVPELTPASYKPRGNTPLIDAAYTTIIATQTAIDKRGDSPKVVICIQTDGEENASHAHNWKDLAALVKQKTELGWQFNFMGCGIDAYAQGMRMGVSSAQTVSYDRFSPEKAAAIFRSSASNTAQFACGESVNTAYSMDQRIAAGDAFVPPDLNLDPAKLAIAVSKIVTPAPIKWTTGANLDLTKVEDLVL